MSTLLEERIRDWAVWFHQNKDRMPSDNLRKRLDFLEKALDGCLELVAIATKDIQKLEHREKSPNLWLPSGVDIQGDIRKFG